MFNKKILAATLALGILAGSSAFASRATNMVLGSGDGNTVLNSGSFFYDDSRNIFYNPAYINDFKNWATIEKSNYPGTTAEGGFVASMGNLNIGAYFNRGDAVIAYPSLARNGTRLGGTGYQAATPIRPIELFFGGDMGVKWGLGLTIANAGPRANTATGTAPSNAVAGNSSYVAVNAGVSVANVEPFLGVQVMGNDQSKDAKHSHIRAGVRYHWGEWTPYAALISTKYKNDVAAAGALAKANELSFGLGLGRSTKITDNARLNYAVSAWRVSDKENDVDPKHTRTILPIDFSAEGDATGWLTLRAGLSYRLFDRIGGPNARDTADSTTGRIGATVHAAKCDFDLAIGNTLGVAESGTTADTQVFGLGGGLFTAASLTYHW